VAIVCGSLRGIYVVGKGLLEIRRIRWGLDAKKQRMVILATRLVPDAEVVGKIARGCHFRKMVSNQPPRM